jgi:hypothetical protein
MPDLTEQNLPALRAHRLPGLELGDGFVYPHYAGHSILNLPNSLCHWLDAPPFGAAPLAPELLSAPGSGFRQVILVLMDALALHRLQRWMKDGTAPVWHVLAQAGSLFPLTSICPSTTSAAITTLWTGRSAAEHGIAGYELWLKEYGVVANMILHAPITFQGDAGSLARAGFQPETFISFPTLGAHLAAAEIKTYAFQHSSIVRSGLSQMFLKDTRLQAFSTAADLWVNVRQLVESRPDERAYIWVYWSEVDHLSHLYGPDDERVAAEFGSFSTALQRLFLDRLSPAARQDTLLILTADHGQVTTRKTLHNDLRHHAELTRRLHLLPTGENRLAYLYLRPGAVESAAEYIQRTWPGQFVLIDPAAAVSAGLFGPGEPHPRLLDRLGDQLLLAHGQHYLWWAEKENPLLGRHGGLAADEMLVPYLAVSLRNL